MNELDVRCASVAEPAGIGIVRDDAMMEQVAIHAIQKFTKRLNLRAGKIPAPQSLLDPWRNQIVPQRAVAYVTSLLVRGMGGCKTPSSSPNLQENPCGAFLGNIFMRSLRPLVLSWRFCLDMVATHEI